MGQASRALGWSFLSNAGARFGTLAIGVLLARLLGPHAFGTFAVALVALLAVLSFNELGVSLAIVRWQGDPAEIAPTVTTLSRRVQHHHLHRLFLRRARVLLGYGSPGRHERYPRSRAECNSGRYCRDAGSVVATVFSPRPQDDRRSGEQLAWGGDIDRPGRVRFRCNEPRDRPDGRRGGRGCAVHRVLSVAVSSRLRPRQGSRPAPVRHASSRGEHSRIRGH